MRSPEVIVTAFVLFGTLIAVLLEAKIQCDADLTTKFAIEKRNLEKQLDCRMDMENVAKCPNISAVDEAWHRFEEVNDEYSEAIAECKRLQHARRRRGGGCACQMDGKDHRVPHDDTGPHGTGGSHGHRLRRHCGCSMKLRRRLRPPEHKMSDDTSADDDDEYRRQRKTMKHRKDDEADGYMSEYEDENEDGNDDDEWLRGRRMRRHRQHNVAGLQKHERQHHGRAHVPARHHRKHGSPGRRKMKVEETSPKLRSHRRRHDHGSNDDPSDPEQVPDANDRSRSLLRVRRGGGSCILTGSTESERLQAKYASLCDRNSICDKENLRGERKDAMKELSKRRQRIYRQYLSQFDQCYGSVMHP